MTLTLPRKPFEAALAQVAQVAPSRSNIPILSHTLIAAEEDGTVRLTARDLDMSLSVSLAQCTGSGAHFCLPARLAHDIVRKLAGDSVRLALGESSAVFSAGRASLTVQSLPAVDFPALHSDDLSTPQPLPARLLAGGMAEAEVAVSKEEARYYLNGVYLHNIGPDLVLVATDGHRLVRRILPGVSCPGLPQAGIIIPSAAVSQIAAMAEAAGDGDIDLSFSSRMVAAQIPGRRLTSKLIDGTFPDYQRVIPQAGAVTITLSRADLAAAVERVALIASERGKAVRLAAMPTGGVTLTCVNPDAGSGEEEVPAAVDGVGGGFEIGFNSAYLLGLLALNDDDRVTLNVDSPGAPARITFDGAPDLTAIIMPMRV